MKDGGPAFPRANTLDQMGMTLLQHYAGLAMQATIIGVVTNTAFPVEHSHPRAIAETAFGQAVAMLEVEEKLREGE